MLFDAIRRVRDAGFVVVDSKRVHELRVQSSIVDAERFYAKVDMQAMVRREMITCLAADLTKRQEILSWRYTQDADVGRVIIKASMLAIEPRWKTGEPTP